MGTIAARKTADVIDLVYHVLSIHALALAQAAELRSDGTLDGFAPGSRELVRWVRECAPALGDDRPLSAEIQRLSARLEQVDWQHELTGAMVVC